MEMQTIITQKLTNFILNFYLMNQDWVTIINKASDINKASWDESNNICNFDTINSRFYYSAFGGIKDVQYKINYVEFAYSRRLWQVKELDYNKKVLYPIDMVVSFF